MAFQYYIMAIHDLDNLGYPHDLGKLHVHPYTHYYPKIIP